MAAVPSALLERLARAREYRRAADAERARAPRRGPALPRSEIDGRALVNFASNDYLGLSDHPAVVEAAARAAERYGAGSTASALVGGYLDLHCELEHALADFTGRERALVFPSGYHANLAVLSGLARRRDTVVADRLSHASLLDAAVLARVQLKRYAHADAVMASELLDQAGDGVRFVVTDGVFSMDGDIAPVAALAVAALAGAALLVIDDAHGIGVLGARGAGVTEGLAAEVPLLVGTFGKAFGAAGAFVAGTEELIEALLQSARSYRYTTALAAPLAAAAHAALRLIEAPEHRRRLGARIAYFRDRAAAAGVPVQPSPSAIQAIIVGSAARALAVSARLRAAGVYVPAIRPPTVPAGTARLRVSVTAAHAESDIDQLVGALQAALAA
jgi:8-amino-7-oxononanoate synthase